MITSPAKNVTRARRYGRNPSSLTRGVWPQSSVSGGFGRCLQIFRTALHDWGDLLLTRNSVGS
ncbi:hypothetical protein THAOC_17029, partial [Thalassiosira oceanica]